MKKNFLKGAFFIFTIFLPRAFFSFPNLENFSQFVLSNGMTIFALEDFSTPTIQIEYSAKAGFSCQSAATAGYAPLYAKVFSKAGIYSKANDGEWLLDNLECECAADSARYSIEASPYQTEEIFKELSACAFSPIFQDNDLDQKLKEAKESAAQNAFSAEGFINSAIDSRVFSAAPWKHDSGIYPALFQKQSLSEARSILSEMARNFYSPQNSALFVTGAMSKEKILSLAEKTFGSYAPSPANPIQENNESSKNEQRKFVLSDPELSPDMIQLVCQYTSLSMEQCDLAAVILNQKFSALKNALTNQSVLNIRGADYINADAAHKNNSSRLIIQSLLEKSSVSAFEQSALFEKILKEEIFNFTEEEFEGAKAFLSLNFDLAAGNPRDFMKLLSQFWAVDGIAKSSYEQSGQAGDASSLLQRFLARPERLGAESCEELKFALQNEEPFIFVLVNSKNYKNLAAQFKNASYENVSAKNASWHAQEMYSKIKESLSAKNESGQKEAPSQIFDQKFFDECIENSQSGRLKNGIGIHAKKNSQNSKSAICLYIKGGEAKSAQSELGLESVLTNALAQNIRKVLFEKAQTGILRGPADVRADTNDISALVAIECMAGDEGAALESLGEALIFSELVPAEIDICLSSRKSEQIIKSSAMARQLFSAGVKAFYKSSLYRALYSSKQDILEKIPLTKILEEYAKLLDAGRLEIIAVGNFSFEEIFSKSQEVFESLEPSWEEKELFVPSKEISKNSQKVKIKHTFLTDVSTDKAGPRPALLIPTTDFADPAQYWFKSPEGQGDEAIFDALMTELHFLCQKAVASSSRFQKISVRIEEKSPMISFGALTFFNVQNLSEADSILQEALAKLKEEIKDAAALERIKSLWLVKSFEGADKNLGSANLLAKKIDEARAKEKDFDAKGALADDYKAVTQADQAAFEIVFENCFSKNFLLYSADSKK
ncbi:MAG: insulinase family protein [Treponema sp.]|nr:insulinase family protein [Treponema sp.]